MSYLALKTVKQKMRERIYNKLLKLGGAALDILMATKDIDAIIQYAVEHTQKIGNAETQLMIMEYISQHFGGTDVNKRFAL